MAVRLSPTARQQFLDTAGNPYVGAKLFTYQAGTSTKQATYTTSIGDVANTNPLVLDAAGRTPSGLWLTEGASYKFVLAPAFDTDPPASPIYTEDGIKGVNDSTTLSETTGSALVGDNDGADGSMWTTVRGFIAYLASSLGSGIVGFIQAGTGSVLRTLQAKLRDAVSVKDFGAVGDGLTHPLSDYYASLAAAQDVYPHALALTDEIDGIAIQACINAGYVADLGRGVFLTTYEIVCADGTGIIGKGAHWKRRTGYIYTAAKNSVIKYVGAAGANTCVVRLSETAVGVVGTDFNSTGDGATHDLIDVVARDFHIDANGLADYACYVYRVGNQATIGNITAEKAVKANHVHLGCYAAQFGTFGAYEGVDQGVICGWDIFGWSSVEATNFAYVARFLTANNGTSGAYVAGTTTDLDGAGGKFSVGRGSRIYLTSESNAGRAAVLSQYLIGSGAGGPSEYFLEYLEGNADGPYVDYRDSMDSIRLRCGFIHPGNGTSLLPQNFRLEGKTDDGVVTENSGPSSASEWLLIEGAIGDLSGVGVEINSNTYKYHVRDSYEGITYPATTPAVVRNSGNQINASVYFTAEATPTVWKSINGTLTRTGTGSYLLTFTHPFKTSGSIIPFLSVIVDVGSPYDTTARISSISTTSATLRIYNGAGELADTGDRISMALVGELQ